MTKTTVLTQVGEMDVPAQSILPLDLTPKCTMDEKTFAKYDTQPENGGFVFNAFPGTIADTVHRLINLFNQAGCQLVYQVRCKLFEI
jgi:hypothetical protein